MKLIETPTSQVKFQLYSFNSLLPKYEEALEPSSWLDHTQVDLQLFDEKEKKHCMICELQLGEQLELVQLLPA